MKDLFSETIREVFSNLSPTEQKTFGEAWRELLIKMSPARKKVVIGK